MKLIIMRHGQASWSGPSDAERALTDKGRVQVMSTAKILMSRYAVGSILASPYLRAQQTAELLAEPLMCPITTVPELKPEGHMDMLMELIPEDKIVLLASHMPLVSHFVGLLCEGSMHAGPSFCTAAAAVVKYDVMGIGMATLIEMIEP